MDIIKKYLKEILKKINYKIVPLGSILIDNRQIRNIIYYGKVFEQIKNVEGSVVECGVGKGRSFLYLSYLISAEGLGRKIYGFDSFEGFPDPTVEDKSLRAPKKGEWSGVEIKEIFDVLSNAGIKQDFINENVTLIKGYFNKTLNTYKGGKIALLHIDVDLYESYRDCLHGLYKFVSIGGVVMFDEYKSERWPGATKAIDDFFGERIKEIKFDSSSGKYYFVKTN